MGDTIGIIFAVLLLVVGAIGTVAPVIPGVPLSWGGLLLLKFLPSLQDEISWTTIVLLGILTLGVTLLDNILPVWGTKKLGGNKKVVWGATIGLLVGFGAWLGPNYRTSFKEQLAACRAQGALYRDRLLPRIPPETVAK